MAKKFGFGGGGGGGHGATAVNKGAIWAAWLLSTCGFAILLAGVAAMQQACGGTQLGGEQLASIGGGSVGYLAPVPCNHLFQYAWWITFLHFFAWLLVLVYLAMNVIHKTRAALVGILAIASVLLMDTANTFLMYNYIPGGILTGKFSARTRTTVAGAIISAVADMLLILIIGYGHDRHDHTRETAVPAATTTTTTTAAGTVPVPVSTAV